MVVAFVRGGWADVDALGTGRPTTVTLACEGLVRSSREPKRRLIMSCINTDTVSGSSGEAGPVHPRQPKASRRASQCPPRHSERLGQTTQDEETRADLLTWIGEDERGRELETVALGRPDCLLVIHVMPTHYRRNKP